jgi:1,4-dihydroxy-2-naphthoate octaprenyltransferase
MKIRIWIQAFRLRTLPLALSCTILGSFLAYAQGVFQWSVLILAAATTLLLQILSNLANDYGDWIHGTDNAQRIGPGRVTQQGLVSKPGMKTAIIICSALALVSGTSLILTSLAHIKQVIVFFLIGLIAIVAAVKYTVGKNPYGYVGLGDIFVFLFFGIIGVAGTFYLHTNNFDPWILLPASTVGMLSSGVLNLNNMRDIENDSRSGKRTLVVRIGSKAAKWYHVFLITFSMLLSLIFTLHYYKSVYQFLFLLTFPLFVMNIKVVLQNTEPGELNTELRKLALTTFIFSVTFGLGLIL